MRPLGSPALTVSTSAPAAASNSAPGVAGAIGGRSAPRKTLRVMTLTSVVLAVAAGATANDAAATAAPMREIRLSMNATLTTAAVYAASPATPVPARSSARTPIQ